MAEPGAPTEAYADAPETGGRPPWWRRAARSARSHWIITTGTLVLLGALAVGGYLYSQVEPLLSVKDTTVAYTVPAAPHLVAGLHETVYRIDPTRSSMTYGVVEQIAGQTAHHVSGSTNGIAGDLALNHADPAASRVGDIKVNVEELHSDNSLRDAQLRQRYLESQLHPIATFHTTKLTGMPSSVAAGQTYHFSITGDLDVHAVSAPATWQASATARPGGEVDVTANTTVKMSNYGVGPINLAGLVSTGDDVTLTFKFVALDPSNHVIPTTINPPPGVHRAGSGPSFKTAVAPILEQHCASCHAPGQVGAAHWELQTAGDAAQYADGLHVVTESKYMPPWPASSLGVPLLGSKALSQSDIDTISAWAAAGGKLDEPASTPITPAEPKAGTVPRHDVVMRMPQAYTGALTNKNDYRCFVLDPHITKPTYVTGYEVTPDKVAEIHHAQIFHITAGQVASAADLEGKDGKPGWSCYTGPNLPDRDAYKNFEKDRSKLHRGLSGGFTGQPGLIAGWVPGQDPVIYPHDSGILFQPGDAIVLQIHYHYDTTPTPDRTTVSLQLTSGSAPVKPIEIVNPIAPVEIPCMPGVTAPLCNRQAALDDDARLYGPAGEFIEPGLLALCGTSSDALAAQFEDGVAHTTCTYTVPYTGDIVSFMGHMHTLGKSFRFTLDPGTPQQKILLDIPTWNFDWQMNYAPVTPVHVTQGEKIQMSCSWDRSLDPNRPPKYIVFAEGTEDEMCFGAYSIIPDGS